MDIRVLQFKTEYQPGKPDADWVLFTGKDAMSENGQLSCATWEKISRIRPPEYMSNDDGGLKMAAMRSQWSQIEPAYAAWKSGNEIPDHGTPLAAWPGVNPQQADVLKAVGLKTVEAVAEVAETILARPPLPDMREIKRQAALWLEGRAGADQAAVIADLQAQNAAMLEMLSELQADKPKRGRPAKEQEAA
jgi:hypothetical protein